MSEQYGDSSLSASQVDLLDLAYRGDLSETVLAGVQWLADRQGEDGGWGAVPGGPSDLVTSLLVYSAFKLTCVPAKHADLEPRLEEYLDRQGGVAAFQRVTEHRDLLFGVLANCAVASIVPWRQTPVVRFERAAGPAWLRRLLGNPPFDRDDPVALAVGLARSLSVKPANRILGWIRLSSVEQCLSLIGEQQSPGGGFHDSTLSTSFVVMALASAGQASHTIVRRAVEFLLSRIQSDASWCERSAD